jgi:fumarate hydratase class II
MPGELINAIVIIKMCAAKVNTHLKKLDYKKANAIIHAANSILDGSYRDQFPLSIWQTGSGTQTNMNVNEVIAHLANEGSKQGLIHPNDDVNKSQSSNDVFPSAIHITGCLTIENKLLPKLKSLIQSLAKLQKQFANIIKVGRTHLQDATPISLGQEISG